MTDWGNIKLGNWVRVKKQYYRVSGVGIKYIILEDKTSTKTVFKLKNIKSIKLNEDVLIKIGASFIVKTKGVNKGHRVAQLKIDDSIFIELSDDKMITIYYKDDTSEKYKHTIIYYKGKKALHTIQNIVSSIISKNLKVNL